jgi:cellulase/cellobiase CelA1
VTFSRRRLVLMVATALAVLAGSLGVATARAAVAPACRVDYKITHQWATGFGADVTVTNLGDPVTGWTLGWSLAPGQGITQAWNATVTAAGAVVTATGLSYNSTVAAGAAVSFGFNGTHTGSNPVPATRHRHPAPVPAHHRPPRRRRRHRPGRSRSGWPATPR